MGLLALRKGPNVGLQVACGCLLLMALVAVMTGAQRASGCLHGFRVVACNPVCSSAEKTQSQDRPFFAPGRQV